jgi:hypothetical protein
LQRLLTTATIGGLLIATAAAFAITERLKLTKSTVYGTHVSSRLSPTCGCARGKATVSFKLRRRDDLTVTILNAHRGEVALLAAQHYPRGEVRLRWNGTTDAGRRAPDGVYRVRIHLAGAHQTIDLPNRILLDTSPPQIKNLVLNRQAFSPDNDKQADFVRITYQLSKQAHLLVYLDGKRILESYRHPLNGSITWDGHVGTSVVKQGSYTLTAGAIDLAGNTTPVGQRWRFHVDVRYIQIAARRIVVPAGKRFEIGVGTDAKRYAWRLGKLKGHSGSPVLRVRAPAQPGRDTLVVEEQGHLDRAAVIVR